MRQLGSRDPRQQPLLLLGLLAGAVIPGASGLRHAPGGSKVLKAATAREGRCSFSQHFDSLGKQVCAGSTFGEPPHGTSPGRVALLVRGESFRSGQGQGDRVDEVTAWSWQAQREASRSHVEYLVRPLEECGFRVDVFIGTYGHRSSLTTKNATRDLLAVYGDRVRGTLVVPDYKKPDYTQGRMYSESLDLLGRYHRQHKVAYDAIVVLRHDIVLKQSLLELPNVQWQNVLLAFKDLQFFANRVNDMVQWFPWKYANCAVKCGFSGHHGDCLMEEAGEGHLGFMLPGEHNSNTRSETNTLYKLVRGSPRERHAAVLLACGRPFGPEQLQRGSDHPDALNLQRSDQQLLTSALTVLGKAFEKHVLVPNNQHVADVHHKVDVVAHCWAPVPEQAFRQAFRPVAAAFEDVGPLEAAFRAKPGVGHHYWESVAWAYSVKRALELLAKHERSTGSTYDRVLFLRPEMLVLKDLDMDVSMYPFNDPALHGGSDLGTGAEFHLAAARDVASELGRLYEGLSWQHPAQSYQWIKAFVETRMNTTILEDDTVSGVDEVSYWKIPSVMKEPCDANRLERLRAVGFGSDEAKSLGLACGA